MRVGVREKYWFLGHFRGLQGGALADVAEVDRDSNPVHFPHDPAPEQAETAILRFKAAIADEVAVVISELHHADPKVMKKGNSV